MTTTEPLTEHGQQALEQMVEAQASASVPVRLVPATAVSGGTSLTC